MKTSIVLNCISQVSMISNSTTTDTVVIFQDKCIANPVDGTQILVDEINEVDSGIIETSYDTFSRLTAKLDIDWKKVC